ncbi:MAG: 50S ribosomal protein L21 [Candidatus Levybacteria bacterium]|nr:50S ribosomal protein L21 [Candidatus Levybacteria bacterium]
MKYAVIQTGGKQYKVSEGDVVEVERVSGLSPQAEVVFDKVLLVAGDGSVKLGSPILSGVVVKGVLQNETRGPKIRVMKYKAKVRHRRVTGHRQIFSQVLIQSIIEKKDSEKKLSTAPAKPGKRATKKKAE